MFTLEKALSPICSTCQPWFPGPCSIGNFQRMSTFEMKSSSILTASADWQIHQSKCDSCNVNVYIYIYVSLSLARGPPHPDSEDPTLYHDMPIRGHRGFCTAVDL